MNTLSKFQMGISNLMSYRNQPMQEETPIIYLLEIKRLTLGSLHFSMNVYA